MEEADEKAYGWLTNPDNEIHKAFLLSLRLYNDVATNKDEEKRGLVTGAACYMKQYNVSMEEVIKVYGEMIDGVWKELNQACIRPVPVPYRVLRQAINFVRMLDFAYRYDDEYTKPEKIWKTYITQVLIHPIPL